MVAIQRPTLASDIVDAAPSIKGRAARDAVARNGNRNTSSVRAFFDPIAGISARVCVCVGVCMSGSCLKKPHVSLQHQSAGDVSNLHRMSSM